MEESGIPIFIIIVATAVIFIGVLVSVAAITWIFLMS
jgi:hypothetical protein